MQESLAFPMKPQIVIDWEFGRLKHSQRFPYFTWENFTQLPCLRELPLLRKMATAKRYLNREMVIQPVLLLRYECFGHLQTHEDPVHLASFR